MDFYALLEKYERLQKEIEKEEKKYQVQVDRYKEEERIISQYYKSQEEKTKAEFEELMAEINKAREEEMSKLTTPHLSDKLVAARKEKSEIDKTIRERFSISHQKMCELLKQETGLEWQVREVCGYEDNATYGGQLIRYGIVLINENNPHFMDNKKSIYINGAEPVEHTKDLIRCMTGVAYPRIHRNENQRIAEKFDWFSLFLRSKMPDNDGKDHITNREEIETRCGLYEQEILNSIEKYAKTIALSYNELEEEKESE